MKQSRYDPGAFGHNWLFRPAELGHDIAMSAFIFNKKTEAKAAHRAQVPPGIKGKTRLLEALSEALRFPDYFGRK